MPTFSCRRALGRLSAVLVALAVLLVSGAGSASAHTDRGVAASNYAGQILGMSAPMPGVDLQVANSATASSCATGRRRSSRSTATPTRSTCASARTGCGATPTARRPTSTCASTGTSPCRRTPTRPRSRTGSGCPRSRSTPGTTTAPTGCRRACRRRWPPPPTATTGVRLPVGEPDPAARLQAVKSAMDRGKATGEGAVVSGALAVMGQTPVQVEQRWLDLFAGRATAVVTNIAGPPEPVALAGVPLRGFTAWVPSTGPIGIGLSICSYAGDLPVGIAVDEVLVPDSDQLLTALADEVATLGKLQ